MRSTSLSIVLVAFLTLPALAVAEPDEARASDPSVVSVSKFLKQTSKRPLGLDDVGLLRAIADLVEKEQVTPTPVEPRSRLMVRLRNVPVLDVAEALEQFVENPRETRPVASSISDRTFFASEVTSNTLLLSSPDKATPLLELIAKLDAEPDTVKVSVCIAELTRKADTTDRAAFEGLLLTERILQGEEADTWIEEAKKQGRLDILSRPQIMTLNNQPASIQIGSRVPVIGPEDNQIEQAQVGLSVALTPRIAPTGLIVMELDVERTELADRDAAGRAAVHTTTVQTTLSAEDGQTIVLGGMRQQTKDGVRELIIAVTPQVNPQR